ncbi:MAG: DNA primase [Chloroflexi bacterium]|nr:DNA primase [Chloroflexota bacterium]
MAVVDDIKQRLDIVELISSYMPLQKSGGNYKGLCPFHSEKTPSFIVFPSSQTWHCFGACGTGGDILTFVMRRERVEFSEALRILADKAGIQLAPPSPRQLEIQHAYEELWQINSAAAQLYHAFLLENPEAEIARQYLQRRGLTRESIDEFQLGFAPEGWHFVEDALKKQYTLDALATAGIVVRNEAGDIYDRFRKRLMFPIRDAQGRTIGFAGRVLDDSTPKYLNTSQTPVFDKGKVLYGIDLARTSIRDSGQVIVVEGYMDVIIPRQCGVTNVVAVMGTALTDNHIEALKHVRDLVLALDPDTAGIRATERGYDVARANLERTVVPVPTPEGLIRYEEKLAAAIRVLELPDGLDPDELVLRSRSRWDELVTSAVPVVEYFINKTYEQADLTTAKGKSSAVKRILQLIATIGDGVERSHYLQRVASRFQVSERQLLMDLERSRKDNTAKVQAIRVDEPADAVHNGLSTSPRAEQNQRCLALLLHNPPVARELVASIPFELDTFSEERDRQIASLVVNNMELQELEQARSFIESFDNDLGIYVKSLLEKFSAGPQFSPITFREDLSKTLLRLKRGYLADKTLELQYAQQQSHLEGDQEREREINSLAEKMAQALRQVDRQMLTITYTGRQSSHSITAHGR